MPVQSRKLLVRSALTAMEMQSAKMTTNREDITSFHTCGGSDKLNKILRVASARVAELGSLSSGAKMAMKIFVKRIFTIFASNASFLRVIANLQN